MVVQTKHGTMAIDVTDRIDTTSEIGKNPS
jgi:hypothetical protein